MLSDLKKRLGGRPEEAAAHPPAPADAAVPPPAPAPSAVAVAVGEEPQPAQSRQAEGRWRAAPTPDEVRDYLASLDTAVPGPDGDVLIAQDAGVFLALEGGAIVAGACIAVRGWMVDEGVKVRSLYLELGQVLLEIEPVVRTFREDVNNYVRTTQPTYRAGFGAVAPIGPEIGRGAAVRLVAVVEQDGEFRLLLSGRTIASAGAHLVPRIAEELSAAQLSPEDSAHVASEYLRRIAHATRAAVTAETLDQRTGGGECELTIVLVVDRNTEALGAYVAFLEMQPEHRRVGLVLAFQQPDLAERGAAVLRTLRNTSGFSFLKLVTPSMPVSFGQAARLGLAEAEGALVMVSADTAIPPAAPWIAPLLEQAAQLGESMLWPRIETFDGRPGSLVDLIDDLPMDLLECDHSQALSGLSAVVRSKLTGVAAGAVAGRRNRLAEVFDDAYTDTDFVFADAYLRLTRLDPNLIQPMGLTFTSLAMPEQYVTGPWEPLWNAYLLRSAVMD